MRIPCKKLLVATLIFALLPAEWGRAGMLSIDLVPARSSPTESNAFQSQALTLAVADVLSYPFKKSSGKTWVIRSAKLALLGLVSSSSALAAQTAHHSVFVSRPLAQAIIIGMFLIQWVKWRWPHRLMSRLQPRLNRPLRIRVRTGEPVEDSYEYHPIGIVALSLRTETGDLTYAAKIHRPFTLDELLEMTRAMLMPEQVERLDEYAESTDEPPAFFLNGKETSADTIVMPGDRVEYRKNTLPSAFEPTLNGDWLHAMAMADEMEVRYGITVPAEDRQLIAEFFAGKQHLVEIEQKFVSLNPERSTLPLLVRKVQLALQPADVSHELIRDFLIGTRDAQEMIRYANELHERYSLDQQRGWRLLEEIKYEYEDVQNHSTNRPIFEVAKSLTVLLLAPVFGLAVIAFLFLPMIKFWQGYRANLARGAGLWASLWLASFTTRDYAQNPAIIAWSVRAEEHYHLAMRRAAVGLERNGYPRLAALLRFVGVSWFSELLVPIAEYPVGIYLVGIHAKSALKAHPAALLAAA